MRLAHLMKFDCWIQSADFSTAEYKQLEAGDAVSLFAGTDWQAMIQQELQLSAQKIEFAAPGFGIVHPDGHCIHFCPYPGSDSCWMCFEPVLGRRFLGFLLLPDPRYESNELKFDDISIAIAQFCVPSPDDSFPAFLEKMGVV